MTLIRRIPVENPSLGRFVTQLLNDPFFGEFKGVPVPEVDEGTLAVDVSEDQKSVIVRASLPGFRKEG